MVKGSVAFILGLCSLWLVQSQLQNTLLIGCSSLLLMACLFFMHRSKKKHTDSSHLRLQTNSANHNKRLFNLLVSLSIGVLISNIKLYCWYKFDKTTVPSVAVTTLEGYICNIPTVKPLVAIADKTLNMPQKALPKGPIQNTHYDLNFDFCANRIADKKLNWYNGNKLRLSSYFVTRHDLKRFKAGQRLKILAKVKPIYGRLNPGGFDYARWLVASNYVGTGYVKEILNSSELVLEASNTNPSVKTNAFESTHKGFTSLQKIGAWYHQFRQYTYEHLQSVTTNFNNQKFIIALAMGEKKNITKAEWNVLKNAGTAHLLAISGLHIGIAATWSYFLIYLITSNFVFINRYFPAQKWGLVGAVFGGLSVALLSGFQYPAQRAVIMLFVFVLSRWNSIKWSLAKTLSVAVILIGLFQPFAVLASGFWLSVFAVSLIAFSLSYTSKNKATIEKLKSWSYLNWLLFAGLIPVTWIVFGGFASNGFIANIILIPLTSFLTAPTIYVAMLLSIFGEQLSYPLFWIANFSLEITMMIQQFLAENNATESLGTVSLVTALTLTIIFLSFISPCNFPLRPLIFPTFLLLYFVNTTRHPPSFKMVVYDIGQGLAVSVEVNDKLLIYDTGFGRGSFNMLESSMLPYLNRSQITRIDKVVISHGDSDHAGGLEELKQHFSIQQMYSGEPDRVEGDNCHTAKPWQWANTAFRFLSGNLTKDYRTALRGNNASCILLIETPNNRYLLPGDIEKRTEKRLVKRGLPKVDLLIAPHHGSKSSSTAPFIGQLSPKFVIFSAGYANQWNLPNRQVVERYQSNKAQEFVTLDQGAIIIQEDKNGRLNIDPLKVSVGHFWHFAKE